MTRITQGLVVVLLGVSAAVGGCTENATAVDPASSGSADSGGSGASSGGGTRTGASGSGGSGSTSGSGALVDASGDDANDAASLPPVPLYTLVVDAPGTPSTVSGTVTVRGRSTGFLNVEVWDATHQKPPLGQGTPAADGSFAVTVDTTALAPGATTWTVWGWDSPPGQTFAHSDSVLLSLTIAQSADSGTSPAPDSGAETVGTGDIGAPALGPGPSDAAKVGGAPFVLVKNWDFGTGGTITNTASLVSEFEFHDQFGTIANGTNYGAVIVAPSAATAISASGLGLPGNLQPVEDPAHPNREWTADSILTHVRPLTTSQSTCSVSSHDAGNGSFVAAWTLPDGGSLLGKDILWETRARMPTPLAAYWFALWTSGNQWNKGAEMDVLESFGTPNIYPPADAFHVNSVGGQDTLDYSSWPAGLTSAGVPTSDRDLTQWHVWTWVYEKDDSYVVYFDGYVVQTGILHWTLGGTQGGQAIDMDFLFDMGWGHTQISDVDISLPASDFPITYEIHYSRVYLR